MRTYVIAGAVAFLILNGGLNAGAQSPVGGVLSLQRAVELALDGNPRLKAAARRIDIATGQARQARLRPNPEVSWEGEEISGARRGLGEAEHTVSLSQVIELGGKRSSRTRYAEAGIGIAGIDLESLRRDIRAEVASLFTTAALAQRRMSLIGESIRLTEELQSAAREKVNAGASPAVEAIRADVAIANARLDSVTAHTQWVNAKTALAAVWGAQEPDFDSVRIDLPPITPPPDARDLLPQLEENPDIRRRTAAIARAERGLGMARSLAVPDLTVSAGPRFLAADRSRTFVLGFSLPVPLFSRNQGEIASSKFAIDEAEWEYEAALVRQRSRLSQALQNMETAYNIIETIRNTIIPTASGAFAEIHRGYRQGRFDYLDLFAAQQDLIGARMRYLDLLSNYHQRRIEVERLAGTPAANTGDNNDQ